METELAATEDRTERYLLAFEAGSLPETACGERVRALSTRAAELRNRRADLTSDLDGDEPQAPSGAELAAVRLKIREAVQGGPPAVRKALVQALVHEIRVESRKAIQPVFRLPQGHATELVRAPYGVVEKTLAYSNPEELRERLATWAV